MITFWTWNFILFLLFHKEAFVYNSEIKLKVIGPLICHLSIFEIEILKGEFFQDMKNKLIFSMTSQFYKQSAYNVSILINVFVNLKEISLNKKKQKIIKFK